MKKWEDAIILFRELKSLGNLLACFPNRTRNLASGVGAYEQVFDYTGGFCFGTEYVQVTDSTGHQGEPRPEGSRWILLGSHRKADDITLCGSSSHAM